MKHIYTLAILSFSIGLFSACGDIKTQELDQTQSRAEPSFDLSAYRDLSIDKGCIEHMECVDLCVEFDGKEGAYDCAVDCSNGPSDPCSPGPQALDGDGSRR